MNFAQSYKRFLKCVEFLGVTTYNLYTGVDMQQWAVSCQLFKIYYGQFKHRKKPTHVMFLTLS